MADDRIKLTTPDSAMVRAVAAALCEGIDVEASVSHAIGVMASAFWANRPKYAPNHGRLSQAGIQESLGQTDAALGQSSQTAPESVPFVPVSDHQRATRATTTTTASIQPTVVDTRATLPIDLPFIVKAVTAWNEVVAERTLPGRLIPAPLAPPHGFASAIMRAKEEQPDFNVWLESMRMVRDMTEGAIERVPVKSLQMLLKPHPKDKGGDLMLWRVVEWHDWGKDKPEVKAQEHKKPAHDDVVGQWDAIHAANKTEDEEPFVFDQEAWIAECKRDGIA